MKRYIVLCLFALGRLAAAQQPSAPSPTASFSFRTSGNEFLRMCEPLSEKTPETKQSCILYVIGIADGAYVQEMKQSGNRPYRIPNTVTFEQEYRVAVKYMNDHPVKTNLQTPKLVIEAITAAFPVY